MLVMVIYDDGYDNVNDSDDDDDDDDNKYNDDDGTDLTLVQGTSWSHKAGDRIVFLSAQAEMLVDDYDSRDVWDDDVIVFFFFK